MVTRRGFLAGIGALIAGPAIPKITTRKKEQWIPEEWTAVSWYEVRGSRGPGDPSIVKYLLHSGKRRATFEAVRVVLPVGGAMRVRFSSDLKYVCFYKGGYKLFVNAQDLETWVEEPEYATLVIVRGLEGAPRVRTDGHEPRI